MSSSRIGRWATPYLAAAGLARRRLTERPIPSTPFRAWRRRPRGRFRVRLAAKPDRMPVPERMFRIAGCKALSLHFARDLSESQLEKETTPAGRRRGDRKVSTPRPQGFGARPERAGESVAARRPVLPVTKVWPARAGLGGGMKARWVTPASCKPQRQVATISGQETRPVSFPGALTSGTIGPAWCQLGAHRTPTTVAGVPA